MWYLLVEDLYTLGSAIRLGDRSLNLQPIPQAFEYITPIRQSGSPLIMALRHSLLMFHSKDMLDDEFRAEIAVFLSMLNFEKDNPLRFLSMKSTMRCVRISSICRSTIDRSMAPRSLETIEAYAKLWITLSLLTKPSLDKGMHFITLASAFNADRALTVISRRHLLEDPTSPKLPNDLASFFGQSFDRLVRHWCQIASSTSPRLPIATRVRHIILICSCFVHGEKQDDLRRACIKYNFIPLALETRVELETVGEEDGMNPDDITFISADLDIYIAELGLAIWYSFRVGLLEEAEHMSIMVKYLATTELIDLIMVWAASSSENIQLGMSSPIVTTAIV